MPPPPPASSPASPSTAGPRGSPWQRPPAPRALAVAPGTSSLEDVVAYCRPLGQTLAGLVLNRVPARRRERIAAAFQAAGLPPLALLAEDRALAAPTLAAVAQAL